MKKHLHKLWDTMSDPGLKLPLMVLVLFLTLVLAGVVLLPRPEAPPAETEAEIVFEPGAFLQGPSEQSGLTGERAELSPDSGLEALQPQESLEQLQGLPVLQEETLGWISLEGKEYYLEAEGKRAVGLRKIGGKLYYFDENGVRADSLGVDVSYYDNSIDWELVKAQGIDFAIIRVGGRGWTSGALYSDCRTQEYLRRARAAGIRIGVYFYSTAVDPAEAVEEAEASLKALGGIPLDFPIFIDMEFSGEYPRGRADKLSPSERTEIAIAFCETVRAAGYEAGVYASQNYLKASIDYRVISRYTVWLASYTRENRLPFFDQRYDIWQFTDRGRVAGMTTEADMNVIF